MYSDSESDEDDYSGLDREVVEEVKKEPPLGVTGLALAEHYFGPLLLPVAADPARWTKYTEHRLGVNAKYKNVFVRPKRSISESIASIEGELSLDEGTLQKCVSILLRDFMWDGNKPRRAIILVRIYSPSTPKYVDVHIDYYQRSRMDSIEWCYSLGYRIYNRISGPPTAYHEPTVEGAIPMWHRRDGWQPICWGLYDDENNYNPNWRPIEVAAMELHQEGVLNVHEALFGPNEGPSRDQADEVLEYRRKLVATVRLLLAAVGIDYEVACTDEERDVDSKVYSLEGLTDNWVARGIRRACGFQLIRDPEEARRGEEEREAMAFGEIVDDEDEDENEFSDDE